MRGERGLTDSCCRGYPNNVNKVSFLLDPRTPAGVDAGCRSGCPDATSESKVLQVTIRRIAASRGDTVATSSESRLDQDKQFQDRVSMS